MAVGSAQRLIPRNMKHRFDNTVIITCVGWYHEQIGGSLKLATEFAEHLARRGFRVCYVCGTYDRQPTNPTVQHGVELWRYPFPQAVSPDPRNILDHVRSTYRLTRRITENANVIAINGHTPLQFLGASLAMRRAKVAKVYTVHSPFAEELSSQWSGDRPSWKRKAALHVAEKIDAWNCRQATVVQCESDYTRDVLVGKYGPAVGSKVRVCPGWVDTFRFQASDDVDILRERLGPPWQRGIPTFFTLRRLEKRMGLETLIDSVALLVRQGHDFRLIIGGGGSLKETLAEQIAAKGLQRHVFLLGRILDEHLPICFAAADCFVLPTSSLECFGLIILEAYACGTPVIATPVGAIPELVRQFGPEWLTEGTSEEQIAERMAKFLRGELVWDAHTLREFARGYDVQTGWQRLETLVLNGAVAGTRLLAVDTTN
jgi:glycosyltransferase involved in cell wall biosynthesis